MQPGSSCTRFLCGVLGLAVWSAVASPAVADEPDAAGTALKSTAGLVVSGAVHGAGNVITVYTSGFLGFVGLSINAVTPFLTAAAVHGVGKARNEEGTYGAALGGAALGTVVGAGLGFSTMLLAEKASPRIGIQRTPGLYWTVLTLAESISTTAFCVGFANLSARRNSDEALGKSMPVALSYTGRF